MPVPGPRSQFGPDPGHRNPFGQTPDRFHDSPYVPIDEPGRTPGTMERTLRGCILAAGQIRAMYRQAANYIAPQQPYSWTDNGHAFAPIRGVGITRALRYMTRSVYSWAGADNTRLSELHTIVGPRVRHKPVTVAGGSVRSRPTVRNRMSSFGARVPTINARQEEGAE